MHPAPAPDGNRDMISFRSGAQEFCMNIRTVREIRGWTVATPMPHAPDYVVGVINLRGAVMPVVNLGSRLGFGPTEPTERHAIIVTDFGDRQVGLLVDAVCDTLTIKGDQLQPAPEIGSLRASAFVEGFLPLDGRMINVLALDHVIPGRRAH